MFLTRISSPQALGLGHPPGLVQRSRNHGSSERRQKQTEVIVVVVRRDGSCHSLPAATPAATIIPHPAAAATHLWLAGNEGMEADMETTMMC